jgi:putative ABC transport system substrate-binding protein
MRRRAFISLLGAAAAWPVVARAQSGERMRRIGVLMTFGADDAIGQARVAAFVQGLQQAGWEVGRNVRVDIHWSGPNPEDVRRHADELVALAPEVILANGSAAAGPLLQATRSVPIVFAIVPDPLCERSLRPALKDAVER